MRILHLIRGSCSPVPDAPSHALFGAMADCARRIALAPDDDHRVVLLGDRHARRDANLAGLRVDRHIHPPLGLHTLAWSSLRREIAWRPAEVALWSPDLERLAAHLRPAVARPTPWAANTVEPGGSTVPAQPHAPPPRHRPPSASERTAVRSALGLTDRDRLVALLADPPSDADTRRFAFIVALVEVGAGPLIGLVSGGSAQIVRGRRFHRLCTRKSPLLAIRGPMLPWLHAADIAVLEGPRRFSTLAAANRALELAVPLVTPRWLAEDRPDLVGTHFFPADGRARTLLPAILQALESAARGRLPASLAAPATQQSPA